MGRIDSGPRPEKGKKTATSLKELFPSFLFVSFIGQSCYNVITPETGKSVTQTGCCRFHVTVQCVSISIDSNAIDQNPSEPNPIEDDNKL
ncbi:hypothetical protein OUZ56_030197 [Daphnia magna]|uniref:Uncharacterized protein n=1 Tax=Daphnia magna TaxID=35525 RepID=A0ABQ9ZQK1_9CRUS|nr:hypothetical protein OUZ56_030197 [Daphnia magna]